MTWPPLIQPSSWPAVAVTLPFQARCFFLACYDDESQSPSSSSPLSGKQKVMRHLRHFHLHHHLHEGKNGKHCPSLRSHLDVFLSALNRGVHSQLSQPAALSNGYVCIHPRTPLHVHSDPSSWWLMISKISEMCVSLNSLTVLLIQ